MIKTLIVVICAASVLLLLIGTLLYSAKKAPYVYVCHNIDKYTDRDLIHKLMEEYGMTEDTAFDLVQEVKRDLR
jgi:hypothetical protein